MLTVLASVAIFGATVASRPADFDRSVESISFGGSERSFILHAPPAGTPRPLVIVLHGWTASGALCEANTRMAARATERGYVVAFPDGTGARRGWNAGFIDLSGTKADDPAFVMAVVDAIGRKTSIDPRRVFVCGHSNGAFLSHAVAARYGDRVAAIGAVAGTTGVGERRLAKPTGRPSVMLIHAVDDSVVAYAADSKALLRGVAMPESAQWWATSLGLAKVATDERSAFPGAQRVDRWREAADGVEVLAVTLAEGGHQWPGGRTVGGVETRSGADATKMLLDFFDTRPRR
ncbi:MAG: PHB depolymerase family esterase [Fimbriimonadaceae bacterium]|nr:PHB depolymerase family esterase [Fimbriimonadaceae bacterium]